MTTDQTVPVTFMPSGRRGPIARGTTVLDAAKELGVGIESLCGGRITCSKCLVQPQPQESGTGQLSIPADDERAFLAKLGRTDCRLACQARVEGPVQLFVPPESRAQKQIILKSATERVIEIDAAVQRFYVTVPPAQLGEHEGDWGRVRQALREQWQIDVSSIDLRALRNLQPALRAGDWSVTVTVWQDSTVIDVQPGYQEGIVGLAVDIGTTTVAVYLCDLRTGAVLATAADMNPQVVYGEDLMSRISYCIEHARGVDTLQQAIVKTVNQLAAQAARAAGLQARHIMDAVFVGNTTMTHLLLGISPREIGIAPFPLAVREGVDLRAQELGVRLHPGARIHVLPSVAGHVGSDNVGVILAEAPQQHDEMTLIVDVGTNAEIILGNREHLYSASSPTGPAFEGAHILHGMRAAPGAIERVRVDPVTQEPRFRVVGEPRWSDTWRLGPDVPLDEQPAHLAAGVCGSGIIEAVAELVMAGVVLPSGRFDPDCRSPRVLHDGPGSAYVLASAEQSATNRPITITQQDVRNIQLAKAALYGGARLLMARADIEQVDRVILAGAFGSTIDPLHALVLGLIPACELSRIHAVGNAAGDGARIALLNRQKRREAQTLVNQITYVETAADPQFQTLFAAAIAIPHADDPFPQIADRLPPPKESQAPRRYRPRSRG